MPLAVMQTFSRESCKMMGISFLNAPAGSRSAAHGRPLLWALLLIGLCSGCLAGGGVDVGVAHQLFDGVHKLCGQALNDALDVVCERGYNAISKRHMDATSTVLEMGLDPGHIQLQPHASYALSPLLSSIYGTQVLIKTRRLKRQSGGISDECCHNTCTYSELSNYCRRK